MTVKMADARWEWAAGGSVQRAVCKSDSGIAAPITPNETLETINNNIPCDTLHVGLTYHTVIHCGLKYHALHVYTLAQHTTSCRSIHVGIYRAYHLPSNKPNLTRNCSVRAGRIPLLQRKWYDIIVESVRLGYFCDSKMSCRWAVSGPPRCPRGDWFNWLGFGFGRGGGSHRLALCQDPRSGRARNRETQSKDP